MKPLRFHVRVQQEVNEAVHWYEDQRAGLGDDFFAKFSDDAQIASPSAWLSE